MSPSRATILHVCMYAIASLCGPAPLLEVSRSHIALRPRIDRLSVDCFACPTIPDLVAEWSL